MALPKEYKITYKDNGASQELTLFEVLALGEAYLNETDVNGDLLATVERIEDTHKTAATPKVEDAPATAVPVNAGAPDVTGTGTNETPVT